MHALIAVLIVFLLAWATVSTALYLRECILHKKLQEKQQAMLMERERTRIYPSAKRPPNALRDPREHDAYRPSTPANTQPTADGAVRVLPGPASRDSTLRLVPDDRGGCDDDCPVPRDHAR